VAVAHASAACSSTPRRDGYARRRPEGTLLYQIVDQYWPIFRDRAEQGGGLPDFVVEEFEAYLRCGILEHGLAHLACRRCGESLVVAFSCKKRGFCPSCLGRRMSDVAAHLVDEVLPEVPVRQWVCSLPWRLRYAMGYDRRLCSDVLTAFVSSLRRSLRHRAKRELGLRSVTDAQIGALTFIQRADSSLRLSVHFHTLVLDGVYIRGPTGGLRFHRLTRPTSEQVAEVARWTHERLGRVLERHGRSLDELDDAPDELAQDQPALASCYHGVLTAHANARSEVVPGRVLEPAAPTQLRLFDGEAVELEPGVISVNYFFRLATIISAGARLARPRSATSHAG
jgi:hypothetical protein